MAYKSGYDIFPTKQARESHKRNQTCMTEPKSTSRRTYNCQIDNYTAVKRVL